MSRIWVDPVDRTQPASERLVFTDRSGRFVDLAMTSQAQQFMRSATGPRAVRLSVSDDELRRWEGRSRPRQLFAGALLPGSEEALTRISSNALGKLKWLTLLCRYADNPVGTLHGRAAFDSLTADVAAYWTESSSGLLDVSGSDVVGWVTMPANEAHYIGGTDGIFGDQATDCLRAAMPTIDLRRYAGINFQLSGRLRQAGGVGGVVYMGVGGEVRRMGFTVDSYVPSSARQLLSLYAHEMGHGMGLHHTNNWANVEYATRYDVMGSAGAVHTIAANKDRLNWIPASRVVRLGPNNTQATIHLVAHARPAATGTLIVYAPAPGQNNLHFTVEARKRSGFDQAIPSEGVLVHGVSDASQSRIADTDMDNATFDADDILIVGESWSDPTSGFFVRVDSASTTGFWTTVRVGGTVATHTVTYRVQGEGAIRSAVTIPTSLQCDSLCTQEVTHASVISLRAVQGADSTAFAGWGGACAAAQTNPACQVSVLSDMTVIANFGNGAIINVSKSGLGVVFSSPLGISCWHRAIQNVCSYGFTPGVNVALTATPDSAHYFAGFSGACSGPVCSVNAFGVKNVAVDFRQGVTIAMLPRGAGSVIMAGRVGCSAPAASCFPGVAPGTQVTLAAAASPGWTFSGWSGMCVGSTVPQCSFTATQNVAVQALFSAPLTASLTGPTSRKYFTPQVPYQFRFDSTFLNVTGSATPPRYFVRSTSRRIDPYLSTGVGSGWIRWYFNASGVAPGLYVDTLFISVPGVAEGSSLFVVDTSEIVLPATGILARSVRVDSSMQGLTVQRRDSVQLRITGFDSTNAFWSAFSRRGYNIVETRSGRGGAMLRWRKALAAQQAVTTLVDSIFVVVNNATGAPLIFVDSLRILPALGATLSAGGRRTFVAHGSSQVITDSVQLNLSGYAQSTVSWTALGNRPWLSVQNPTGSGPATIHWNRTAVGLSAGTHVDTIRVVVNGPVPITVRFVDTLAVSVALPAVAAVAREFVAGGVVTAEQRIALDELGNRDGVLNVGDFLAHVARSGIPLRPDVIAEVLAAADTAADRNGRSRPTKQGAPRP